MASIISYFTKNQVLSSSSGLEIYEFTGDATAFVRDCEHRFREAYISEEKLVRITAKSKDTRKDAIELRLPKMTKNKAADFGEILSYYLWTETFAADANICPMKMRWKEHPDMPGHLVDVILLKKVDEGNACPDDKMYTIESKVWTSPMGTNCHSSLSDDLNWAIKDRTERAAKTIPYLVIQYERDEEYDLAVQVRRFGDPVNAPYIKEHFAIAIVESSQAKDHISNFDKTLQSANPDIPVYLLPIADLKNIYNNLFLSIPND